MKYWVITIPILALATTGMVMMSGCASMLAVNSDSRNSQPINNPFGDLYSNGRTEAPDPIILRTKKGDRSVEVELSRHQQEMTDFVIPISPAFRDTEGGRNPASTSNGSVDETYKDQAPGLSDREIMATLPQGPAEDEATRREIESGLGLMPAEDSVPTRDKSYLASMDRIKQLYRSGRYEAALMDADSMIRQFQTDPKLYQMRGTLLDRLGKKDLALKAWNQALRFDPNNVGLRRFIERHQTRGLASP
ncbi:MAG TPA: hypothetical protein DCS07_15025 [Bdellovibrionales bacterium]|nr:MAG: hypothetical protein A2Z97_10135 [Bdellovibrionales bacterium GWB1_52_6]OFZ05276.1 MAG: hypothetical protein A2X97_10845 [Bdellovibrionales bacterium GWA1_52_35]OFZ42162.1 MAG: hypothetical protein A2070_07525 [Bdellovibrionales bacterium GWC1_52_8]HAR43923.1 hypothetical protein [Bdellovibrionales bacterium]HCM38586.1 hypothetical protein [Bdellovibrionales bacterium]